MTSKESPDVRIRVPGRPEYISVVRLGMAGLAHRLGLETDEAEDLKLAVAEACSRVLHSPGSGLLVVDCQHCPEHVAITVQWSAPGGGRGSVDEPSELGTFLIKALVDEVVFLDEGGGLRLIKRLGAARDEAEAS